MTQPISLPALNVLVLDRSAVGRQLTEFLLHRRGHSVKAVARLADVEQAPGQFHLVMFDGDLSTAELRRLPSLQHARLCALGAPIDPAAVDGALAKPIVAGQLDDLLADWFEPSIDESGLGEQLGGNIGLLGPLAQLLEKSARSWEVGLKSALAANDAEAVRRQAHQAKGALGNFAARRAMAAARTLEDIGRSGNLADGPAAFSRFIDELRRVRDALAGLLAR